MKQGLKIGLGIFGALVAVGVVRNAIVGPEQARPAPVSSAATAYAAALTVDQQEARSKACNDDLLAWRNRGVVRSGGARPRIEREVWGQLSAGEKSEIFEIAACIQSGALPGEQFVTVESFPFEGSSMETRRTPNHHRLPLVSGGPPTK